MVVDNRGITQRYAGYAYVGSANLSESAWGRVTFDTKGKQSKLTCRNWESGVVIPIPSDDLPGRECESTNRINKLLQLKSTNFGTEVVTYDKEATGANMPCPASDQGINTANHASLAEARHLQIDRLDHAHEFSNLSLNETFSPLVPVPVKDDHSLIDKGLEPWFFLS